MFGGLGSWMCGCLGGWMFGYFKQLDVWLFWVGGWMFGYFGWVAGCLAVLMAKVDSQFGSDQLLGVMI